MIRTIIGVKTTFTRGILLSQPSGGEKAKCGGSIIPGHGMVVAGLLPRSRTRGASGGRSGESSGRPTAGMQTEESPRSMICRERVCVG